MSPGFCLSRCILSHGHAADDNTGVEYEALGNQIKVPAVDAGEHELTASFYTDNQIATQKQNGETTSYTYDPAGRTEKTVSEGSTKATVINHYPGSGGAISWSEEEEGKDWTRNIPGIDGSLAATQHNSEAAVLQLHDLEGNVVATAADSETETKLLTSYNSTEFGVPVNGAPPTKFSWLGASGYTAEQSSGAANPGGGSYVPQLGRELQTEPIIQPGAAPDGSYSGAPYTTYVSAEAIALGNDFAAGAPGREATRQAEIRQKREEEEEEAKRRHREEEEAILNAPTPTEGGAEEPANYCLLAIITEQEDEGCGDGGNGGYECSGGNACAAAPCSNGDNPHSGHCGAQLPGRELCSNPLQQGCRVSTGRLPNGTRLGKLQIINSPEGPLAGCIVGGVVGGTFAVYSTAGLAVQVGATGGCFVGGGLVIIAERIF
jgi:YD repeat-containing protein